MPELPEVETIRRQLAQKIIGRRLNNKKIIARIGNIYSDEILFVAGIRPMRQVKTLTDQEIKKIFIGDYARYHKVYQKQTCSKCGAKIIKIKFAGRSGHYCPGCQA